MTEEKQKRLNLLRYGLFVVVIVAFSLTLSWSRIASLGLMDWGTSIMWTVIITVVVGLVAAGIYVAYERMLRNS